VSERKFVDENAHEELIIPGAATPEIQAGEGIIT
jgi:hypothetical protein